LGLDCGCILNFFLLVFGYFSESSQKNLFYNVCTYFVIPDVSRNFEKSHYDNENQRLFCRKIEIRSKPQNGSAVVVMLMKERKLCSRKGRQLEYS
jgi:hypothetical protein